MFCVVVQISLQFVPLGLIGNKSPIVQVMAWYGAGYKLLQ